MKFTLTYDGELRSANGVRGTQQKWDIRKQLDPQLRELWTVDPGLKWSMLHKWVPKTHAFARVNTHHSNQDIKVPIVGPPAAHKDEKMDLCEPIQVRNRKFLPIIRDSFALNCGLKIKFLRKESPGRIYQGGDLDNRLKTLFDALAVPNADQMIEDQSLEDPIHCLMENDKLISGVEIETHRLLSRPGASEHEVRLIIEVDVRVMQPRSYNEVFLGD